MNRVDEGLLDRQKVLKNYKMKNQGKKVGASRPKSAIRDDLNTPPRTPPVAQTELSVSSSLLGISFAFYRPRCKYLTLTPWEGVNLPDLADLGLEIAREPKIIAAGLAERVYRKPYARQSNHPCPLYCNVS